jgi:RNA ligase
MKLADIMDVGELDRLVAEHYITRRPNDAGYLVLHNYTEKATFDRVWTPETRQCRGIISTRDGTIVARPFDKFFNIDESEETRIDVLESRPGPIDITEKLDGSMIAVWFYDGSWHTSTRGSFTSSQAQAAAWWLAGQPSKLVDILEEFTLLCEWCAPDNRVVLKYDTADLVLIGARLTSTGTDLHYEQLRHVANLAGLRITPHTTDSLAELAAARGDRIGMEGWVARWPNGFRVKIKTQDYLRLHRLVSNFSVSRVRDVLLAAGDAWQAYLTELPEEFRAEAERMASDMQAATAERVQALQATYTRIAPLAAKGRKEYALAVLQEPADDRPYLFSLIDGKPIADKVLASLDLAA